MACVGWVSPISQAATAQSSTPTDASSAADAATAAAIAEAYGHAVVIDPDTTQTEQVSAMPDGTMQLVEYSQPVRVLRSGAWIPVDTSLVAGADGMLTPKVSAAPVKFSAGGAGAFAQVQAPDGSWLSEQWPSGALPAPTVTGSTATYANVLPDVDLQVTATATGMRSVLVVKSAAAASDSGLAAVVFAVSGTTVSATPGTGGTGGAAAASAADGLDAASPSWWDSSQPGSDASGPGGTGMPAPVPDAVSGSSMSLNVAAVANRVGVTFPLYVDPDWTGSTLNRAYVDSAYPTQSYWNDAGGSDAWQHVGYVQASWSDDGLAHTTRSFWEMSLTGVAGADVLAATFNTTEEYASSCNAREVDLWTLGAGITSGTTWNNQPTWATKLSSQTVAYGYDSSCPAHSVGFAATSGVQAGVDAGHSTITLGLRAANEADTYGWKKFGSVASLTISYDHAPTIPTAETVTPCGFTCGDEPVYTNDTTPTFYARSTDADGQNVKYLFDVYAGHSPSPTTLIESAWSVHFLSDGQHTGWWTSTASLTNGDYEYRVLASDDTEDSSWTSYFQFTVDTTPPAAPQLTAAGGLGTSKAAFGGTVGVTQEQVTITPNAADHAFGYAYTIVPSGAQVSFPTNLSCPSAGASGAVAGYTVVCPGTVSSPTTVTVQAPDDTSVFSAITFDAAGNAPGAPASVSFYAGGDYASANTGHSWLTDSRPDGSANPSGCDAAPVPDSQPAPNNVDVTSVSGACWDWNSTAPQGDGTGTSINFTGDGVLTFTGSAAVAKTGQAVLDTTKSFTVAAWVNPASIPSGSSYTILSQAPSPGGQASAFFLKIDPQSQWQFCMRTQSSSPTSSCATAPGTAATGWSFIAGSYEATNHQLLLRVSSSDAPATPTVGSFTQAGATTTGAFTIGQSVFNGDAADQYEGAVLDPVAVQGVLDSAQIQDVADLDTPVSLVAPISGS
jgi:hypothetical protein